MVDTGPWIFGTKVVVPAGVVAHVDLDTEKVYLGRTKDEIKNAPEFDADKLSRRRGLPRPRRQLLRPGLAPRINSDGRCRWCRPSLV